MSPQIKFLNERDPEFFAVLQSRVNGYFKKYKLRKDGGAGLITKSIFLLSVFFIPFTLTITLEPPVYLAVILLIITGIGKAGVGMSIMHDALHGSFSNKKWINDLFGGSLYLLGGNPINWKIQHNVLHHTYPNVYKVDEDISTKAYIVRLSPDSELKGVHRYQWLYVLPLYGLMTLSFMVKDFRQLNRYNKTGETARQGLKPGVEMLKLILTKILYLAIAVLFPILVTDYSVFQVVAGFLIVHFTAGVILSIVFQLAHVVDGIEYPGRNPSGDLQTSWAVHQLATTADFAPGNKFMHWFTGGLNFQVEHHLFPHISHVHYPKIANIVRQTASEYGFSYHCAPNLWAALRSHLKMLKALGSIKKPVLA